VPVVGLTLGAVMLATAGILIYNAIRMTVVARRKEVAIMLLVGARRPMVWAPMVLEGLIQGLLGGSLAALIMVGLHGLVSNILIARMGPQAALPPVGLGSVVLALGALGSLYGTLCSIVAVREPWRQGGVA
jgi:cell division transport system permease protein